MKVYLGVFLRTTLAFASLFIYSRILGKKLISQMTFFDYVAGITMGTLAASLAIEFRNLTGPYFLALTLWGIYSLTMGYLSLKSRKARQYIEGEPTVLIQNGQILEENMQRIRFNIDDLLMGLRQKNVFRVADVEFALLETDGQVSVIPKSQKRPVTPADLHLQTQYEGLSTELIVDGKVIEQNLRQLGLNLPWLKDALRTRNVRSVADVIFAELSSDGTLYIDQKKDTFPVYHRPDDEEPNSEGFHE